MKEHPPTESPPPGDLPGIWRKRAQLLSDFGDSNSGRLWALAATELEQALRVLSEDALTLVEAAALCGYSADHIGSLIRKGKIPNMGRRHAPRIRRRTSPHNHTDLARHQLVFHLVVERGICQVL